MYSIVLDGRVMGQTGLNSPIDSVSAARVTTKTEGSGSLSFTIQPFHKFYTKIFKMKSTVRVFLNGQEIFNGRVLEYEDDLDGNRAVYCEGALSYLLDSTLEPMEGWSGTVHDYICKVIDEHNKSVNSDRQFRIGRLEGKHINDTITIDDDNYQTASDALDSEVTNYFGGYFMVRSYSGLLYLDYTDDYVKHAAQPLEIGLNINSATVKTSSDDLFTILLPLGNDDITIEGVNGGSKYLVDTEGLEKYGKITKSVSFNDANNANTLLQKAQQYMEDHAGDRPKTISVEAIDLSALGKYPPIAAGDRVRIKLNQNDRFYEYTCISVDYDLLNPEATKYDFGEQEVPLSSKMSKTAVQAQTASVEAARASGGVGAANQKIGGLEKDIEVIARDISVQARDIEVMARDIEVNAENIEANAKSFDLRASNIEEVWRQTDSRVTETEDGLERLTEDTKQLRERLTQAEIDINGEEGTIGLKTLYAELDGRMVAFQDDFDTLASRVDKLGESVSAAEVNINSANANIQLWTKRVEAVEGENGELEKRVTSAEINIDSVKGEISSKVSRGNLISEINQSAESIKISASKIDLEGYVTVDNLKTYGGDILAENIEVSNLTVDASIDVDMDVSASRVIAGDFVDESTGISLSNHYHTFTADSSGKVTIEGPSSTPGFFNIADTQFYKDGVSAAAANVTVTSITPFYYSWRKEYSVLVDLSNGKSVAGGYVDATEAYNDGYEAGKGDATISTSDITYRVTDRKIGSCSIDISVAAPDGSTVTRSITFSVPMANSVTVNSSSGTVTLRYINVSSGNTSTQTLGYS